MGHHQATVIIWGDHCTVHLVLSTLKHVVVVVVVVVVTVVVVNYLVRYFYPILLSAVSVFLFSVLFTFYCCFFLVLYCTANLRSKHIARTMNVHS
jgi:hypothetical protein